MRAGREAAAAAASQPGDASDTDRTDPADPGDRTSRKDGKRQRGEAHRGTQLSSADALRAREFAQPTADDLAAAEADVVLVRRHYVPPAPLPRSGRSKSGGSARR